MSIFCTQITLLSTPPHNDKMIIKHINALNENINDIRAMPYPPSFNKIAARIIEPEAGASTWALGSHK